MRRLRLLILFIWNINDVFTLRQDRTNLHELAERIQNGPLIVVVNYQADPLITEDEAKEYEANILDENHAYNLYHVLRTTQDTELLDPKIDEHFEKTKDILRQAIQRRCQKLDKCMEKCPKKKIYSCKIICQEEIDELDVCEKPKKSQKPKKPKCKTPKCGKTMPPKW